MAISAAEEWVGYDRRLQQHLRQIGVRKISIRASPSPTDAEAHAYGIEILRMSGVGYFPMLEDPDGFNRLLQQAVQKCTQSGPSPRPSPRIPGRTSGTAARKWRFGLACG
jgi:hypothetical protein